MDEVIVEGRVLFETPAGGARKWLKWAVIIALILLAIPIGYFGFKYLYFFYESEPFHLTWYNWLFISIFAGFAGFILFLGLITMDIRILENGIEFTNVLGRKRMYGWHELRPYKVGEAIGGGEDYSFGVSIIYGTVVQRVPQTEEAIEYAIRRVPKAVEPIKAGALATLGGTKDGKKGTIQHPVFFKPSEIYPSRSLTSVEREPTRPTGWWTVPRGPAEWGRMLYEPQWARYRRYKHVDRIVGVWIWFGSCLFMIALPISLLITELLRLGTTNAILYPASIFIGMPFDHHRESTSHC